jgi:hypothetical protein
VRSGAPLSAYAQQPRPPGGDDKTWLHPVPFPPPLLQGAGHKAKAFRPWIPRQTQTHPESGAGSTTKPVWAPRRSLIQPISPATIASANPRHHEKRFCNEAAPRPPWATSEAAPPATAPDAQRARLQGHIEDPPRWVKKVERSVSYPLPVTRRAAALSIPALTTLALLASAKGADLLTPQMTGEAPAAGKRVLKTPTNSHRP